MVYNSLPVKANLLRRNIQCDPVCAWCEVSWETEIHCFKEFPWIQNVRLQSPIGSRSFASNCTSAGEWINEILNLWPLRELNIQHLINKAIMATEEMSSSTRTRTPQALHPSTSVDNWKPPPAGWYKINVDAAHAAG
ncbi:ribonuclease H [Sesbania bispinosa]|nr:ribonuclease H [Sesbania bispinosa]